jgi:cell wall-associated NlpC family hydrolase
MRRYLVLAAAAVLIPITLMTAPVNAALASPARPAISAAALDDAAFKWALTQRGTWYQWGGTGPSTYDCSGLVMMAYRHAGVQLPRTTYEMLGSWHLVPVSHPRRGDLVFFSGGAHVELYSGHGHVTFGAHETGQQVGYLDWRSWPAGTSFWEVRA